MAILVFDNYRDQPHILSIREFPISEEKSAREYYLKLCGEYFEESGRVLAYGHHRIRAYLTFADKEPKLIWSNKKDAKYKEGQLNG